MPFALEQLSQGLTVLGYLAPSNHATGADVSITNIDISKIRRLLVVVQTGVLGASATVDCKLQSSATSGGAYSDIAGSPITTITANNKVATIEIRDDEMPSGNRWLQVNLAVGTAASQVGVIVLGAEAEFKPAKSQDIAAVTQRLVV
jgi:hypothetical protein